MKIQISNPWKDNANRPNCIVCSYMTHTPVCHLVMIDRWAGVVLSNGSVEQHFNCPKGVFDLPCVDQKHSRESQPAPGAKASDTTEQRWVRYVKRAHAPLRTPRGSY